MKKLNLLIAVLALGAFAIFGCSGSPEPNANATPQTDKVQGQSKKLGKMNEHIDVK